MNITIRTGRRLAAAIVGCCAILLPGAALAASSAPGAPSAPAGPAARAITPGCETPGLVIWLDTNGNAGAGSVFYNLEFTNLSGHTCSLNGFPFISAVSLTGSLLGHRAAFTGGPVHQITLDQGQTAKAALQIVNVLNIPASKCKPVTAAGFRVFPPNQTRAKVVPVPVRRVFGERAGIHVRAAGHEVASTAAGVRGGPGGGPSRTPAVTHTGPSVRAR